MSKSILIIDDDPLVLKSLLRYLKACNYEAEIASSGLEAIKAVEEKSFDLIVADIRMPEMDGIETITKIRAICNQKYKISIPEIIVTGYASEDSQKAAENLGVAAYFYKPFELNVFIEAVRKALGE